MAFVLLKGAGAFANDSLIESTVSKQFISSNSKSSGNPHIPAPRLVQTAHEFSEMMAQLQTQPLIAVDTESDSLYRYTPRVCLIQISSFRDTSVQDESSPDSIIDYLVDPLRLTELGPLGEILADPSVEVILHAAENDILLLHRDFGFETKNVFDTQLAARIMGRNGVGLAAILEEEFGVISDKSMQRTDWGRRPLTPQQMTYAQIDTHFLPALRSRQLDRLRERDRLREAQEGFAFLERIRYEEPTEGRNFWSMKGTREVERGQLGLLEELWIWREQTAQRLERPPFKVVNDRVLIELTQNPPASLSDLERISGLGSHQVSRYGAEILRAVERGKQRPLPDLPAPTPRPELLLNRHDQKIFQSLRQWRSETSSARGVDPDIVFSNDLLLQIVEHKPRTVEDLSQIPAIGAWKAETYGPAILQLLT